MHVPTVALMNCTGYERSRRTRHVSRRDRVKEIVEGHHRPLFQIAATITTVMRKIDVPRPEGVVVVAAREVVVVAREVVVAERRRRDGGRGVLVATVFVAQAVAAAAVDMAVPTTMNKINKTKTAPPLLLHHSRITVTVERPRRHPSVPHHLTLRIVTTTNNNSVRQLHRQMPITPSFCIENPTRPQPH